MNLDDTASVSRCWTLSESIVHRRDTGTQEQIAQHLRLCDAQFLPPLSARASIEDYAAKIANLAVRFEAWSGDSLVGLTAAYANDLVSRIAFITSVSVVPEWSGRGIGTRLVRDCIRYAKLNNFRRIELEVAMAQGAAIHLYEKCGFKAAQTSAAARASAAAQAQRGVLGMHLDLEGER